MVNVLITGANRGLGYGMVKVLLKDKRVKNVFAAHRDTADIKHLRSIKDDRLHILKVDLVYDDEIKAAAQKVTEIVGNDGLDILINNAAVLYDYDITGNCMRKLICSQMEINAASNFIVTQFFLPLLRKSTKKAGSRTIIVNLADELGSIEMSDGATAKNATLYRMSKASLNMMTRSLGFDLKTENIIVVSLCPGTVQTEMGGPDAELTVEQASRTMIDNILNKINIEHAAMILDRNLNPIKF